VLGKDAGMFQNGTAFRYETAPAKGNRQGFTAKSREISKFVIPAKAGIQYFQTVGKGQAQQAAARAKTQQPCLLLKPMQIVLRSYSGKSEFRRGEVKS
jgi:hypothetical protein